MFRFWLYFVANQAVAPANMLFSLATIPAAFAARCVVLDFTTLSFAQHGPQLNSAFLT